MPYSIITPDGITINNIPDEIDRNTPEGQAMLVKQYEHIKEKIDQQKYEEEKEAMDTAGPIDALLGSFQRYTSSMGTGLDFSGTEEEAALEGVERQQKIAEKYKPGINIPLIEKVYENEGLFAAAKETLSQVPSAVTEQAPILASMYAGAKAGSVLGPKGALVGSLVAPFLSFVGSNMERRAQEQLQAGEQVDVDRLKAAATAVGQASLDRAAVGLSGLSKVFGFNVLEKEVAKNVAKRNMGLALATGVGKYALAEVPTEIAQQALERSYAGLSLTDDDAKREFAETAAATMLSGPLGLYSGYRGERLNRRVIEDRELEEQATLAAARADAERALKEKLKDEALTKDIDELTKVLEDTNATVTYGTDYFTEDSPIKKEIAPILERFEQVEQQAQEALSNRDTNAATDYNKQLLKISENITNRVKRFQKSKLEDIQKQTTKAIKGREFIANELQAAKDLKAEVDMQSKTPGIATDTLLKDWVGLQRRSKSYQELLGKDLKNPEVFKEMVRIFNEYEPNIRENNYGIFLTSLTDYMEKNNGKEIASVYAGERDAILNRSKLQSSKRGKKSNISGTLGNTGNDGEIDGGKGTVNPALKETNKTLLETLEKSKVNLEEETNPVYKKDSKKEVEFLTRMANRFASKDLKGLPNLPKDDKRRLAQLFAEWVDEKQNNPAELEDPAIQAQYKDAVKLIKRYDPTFAKSLQFLDFKPQKGKKGIDQTPAATQPLTEEQPATQELIHEPYSETTNLSEFKDLKNPDLQNVEELLAEVDILYEQLEAARDKIKGQKKPRAKNLQAIAKIEGKMTDSAMRWRVGQRTGDPYNLTPTKLGSLFNSFLFAPSKYARDQLQNHINELKKRSGPSTDEYQEFNSLPADPELIRTVTLGNKTLPQAINTVLRAKKDLSTYEKYILEKIAATPNIGNVRVTEGVQREVGKAYRGSFSSLSNTIRLEPNAANLITIMHEGVHAATVSSIAKHLTRNDKLINNSVLGQELLNMFNTANKADTDNKYAAAFKNVREFVAYGLTDQDFQKFLANTRSVNVAESRISNMWNDLVNFVKNLLKMDDISNTVLNDLLTVTPDLFQGPNPTLVGPTAGTETYYQEETTDPLAMPRRNSTSFFQGMMNQMTNPQFPKTSLGGLFLKARTRISNFAATTQERLQDEYKGEVLLDDQTRADILLDQALHDTAIAGVSSEKGRVVFNEKGFAEVIPDTNNLGSIFSLINKMAERYGVEQAQSMAHRFLVANRFIGEDFLNKTRERQIRDLEKEAQYLLKNQKIERDAKRRAASNRRIAKRIEKKITKITPEQLTASEEAIAEYANIPELQAIKQINKEINLQHIDLLYQAGVYSSAEVETYTETADWYVPVFRVLDQNDPSTKEYFRGFADLGVEFEFKGSEKQVSNVLDNMLKKHFWSVSAAVRNNANFRTAQAVGVTTVDDDGNESLKTYRSESVIPKDKRDSTASVYIDGEQVWVEYESPEFAMAIQGSEVPLSSFGKVGQFFTKTFRLGITANPVFQAYQVFNDALGAALFSGIRRPFRTAISVLNSYKKATFETNDPLLKRMAELGIVGGFYGYEPADISKNLRTKFKLENDTIVKKALRATDDFAANSDVAQRRALFEQTLLETGGVRQADGSVVGGNEVLALNRAMNIINWQRRGQSGFVRQIVHLVPFLNAYIQGMDVVIQSIRGRNVAGMDKVMAKKLFAGTAIKLMVLNLLYTMLVNGADDDDEYEKLDDRQKLRSYMIPGTGFKLPVRAELSLLTKMIPELTYNTIIREGTQNEYDARKVKQAIANSFFDAALGPNLMPQIIRPLAEVTINYDFFRDRPIVGLGYQALDAELQANEYTSEVGKLFGNLGISPMKVDHFIKGVGGTMASMGLYITDSLANKLFDLKRPEVALDRVPLISPVLYSSEGRDRVNDFYDMLTMSDSLTSTVNAYIKRGETEKAKEKIADNKALYLSRDRINYLNRQMAKVREARRAILNSDRTPEEMTKELERLDGIRNNILQNISVVRRQAKL